MCSGTQVICWFSSTIRSRNCGHLHEPRVDGPLDQRVPAAPAVRVRVVVGLVAQQQPLRVRRAGAQVADDLRVRVEHLHPRVRRHRGVELAAGVDRHDGLDARRVRDDLVLLTEGRRDVHQPGAVVGGDVVGGEHAVGVLPAREEVERREVGGAEQLGAGQPAQHARVVSQLAGVGAQPGRGEDEPLARVGRGVSRLDQDVLDVRVHRDSQVRRQRPRRRRPDQGVGTVQVRCVLVLGGGGRGGAARP